MTGLPAWAQALPAALGGSGIFLVALMDSSILSLPAITDGLIVLAATKHPALLWYYALMATLGSVAGTFVVFVVARKGGAAIIGKRKDARRLARIRSAYGRYGAVGVFIASLLPPPVPFKLFVVAAGVSETTVPSLIVAVATGRALRYFAESLLAYWVGARAIDVIRANAPAAALTAAGLALAGLLIWLVRRAWSGGPERPAES